MPQHLGKMSAVLHVPPFNDQKATSRVAPTCGSCPRSIRWSRRSTLSPEEMRMRAPTLAMNGNVGFGGFY
jgi:hypothetical protein